MINSGKHYFAKPKKITDSGKNNFCMLIPLSKRTEGSEYSNSGKVSLHKLFLIVKGET